MRRKIPALPKDKSPETTKESYRSSASLSEDVQCVLGQYARAGIFGTSDIDAIRMFLAQILDTSPHRENESIETLLARIRCIGPRDGLEAMLAVQMIGIHTLAIECTRRSLSKDQTPQGREVNLNRVVKLTRIFASQMAALNLHRGKLAQQMVVGNVNVSDGGQAIVGSVNHDGSLNAISSDDKDPVV